MEKLSLWNTGRIETVQGYLNTDIGQLHHPRYGLDEPKCKKVAVDLLSFLTLPRFYVNGEP